MASCWLDTWLVAAAMRMYSAAVKRADLYRRTIIPKAQETYELSLEAFKGDQCDWRTEGSAKNWATAYDFPAVKDKRVLQEEFPNRSSGVMQAFVPNIRRDQFKDPRVRRALNFAFDFEGLKPRPPSVLHLEIRSPTPRSEATVCEVTKGNIAELAATTFVAQLIVLLSVRTMGYQRRTVQRRRGSQSILIER